jgi:hypothetical protein
VPWEDAAVPSERTVVTELGTALGMLGYERLEDPLAARPDVMRSLSPEVWDQLARLRAGGAYDGDFHAAWENGRAFLHAQDGLRSRLPRLVEWKGAVRAPGDEVAPVDLRIDHVYLVSCKYLSNIVFNTAPSQIFDQLLIGANRSARGDWYAEVAGPEHAALYDAVRHALCAPDASLGSGDAMPDAPARRPSGERSTTLALPGLDDDPDGEERGGGEGPAPSGPMPELLRTLPPRVSGLSGEQRDALSSRLRAGWPSTAAKEAYAALSWAVARGSVTRWQAALDATGSNAGESMLWRLLRMGSAPYFVLGSSATRAAPIRSLRLRIATPWDWRQQFQLRALDIEAQHGGQPRVGWHAALRDRGTTHTHEVEGHVEVRWSHGRFGGLPEAKGYLDTAHAHVPGYFALQ